MPAVHTIIQDIQVWKNGQADKADGHLRGMEAKELILKVKKLYSDSMIPTRGSKEAAGLDLYAHSGGNIPAGERVKIPTGIAMEIPTGCYGDIRSRSSMYARGLEAEGTIDSDYRGEVYVMIHNHADEDITIRLGDRIAQIVIQAYEQCEVMEADELSETERGNKGFGSTGK